MTSEPRPEELVSTTGRLLAPHVVALGGGHGLFATLEALRRVVTDLTAVVTVADNGGSSGRLRGEFGVLPPGDLRMALAALCSDDDWGQRWAEVVQHRFKGGGDMHGHTIGNLLIVALWEILGDHVEALDLVGRLLGAEGRVLPMAVSPMDITASVVHPDGSRGRVRGQVEVATTTGRIESIELDPTTPTACPEAVAAVREADWILLGPGSWYTSVIPHLMVPELRAAISQSEGRLAVVVNLEPQPGETADFRPEDHLEALLDHAPGLRIDSVVADRGALEVSPRLPAYVEAMGARLVVDDLVVDGATGRHDTVKLAAALRRVIEEHAIINPSDLAPEGER